MHPTSPHGSPVVVKPKKQVTLGSVIVTAALAIAGGMGVYLWQQASIDDLEGRLKVLDDKVAQLTIENKLVGASEDEKVIAAAEAKCKVAVPQAGYERYFRLGTSQGKSVRYSKDKTFAYINTGCGDIKKGEIEEVFTVASIYKKAPNSIWVHIHSGQDVPTPPETTLYAIPELSEFE